MMLVGPVSSEAAIEIALGLDGLARLLLHGVIGFTTTHPALTHLVGVELAAAPAVGIARPSYDRTDPDAAPGGGWTPVFSAHVEHLGQAQCLLDPGTANLCCTCLAMTCLDAPELFLTGKEMAGVTGLITAVCLAAPTAPIAGVDLDDLAMAVRRVRSLDDPR